MSMEVFMSKNNAHRQLLILRHGKSDWNAAVEDFYRPLKKRGVESAQKIGHWLNSQQLHPDIIISSPATRALVTANEVAVIIGASEVIQDERIYEASLRQLLEVLSDIHTEYKRPMLVGHNPGFESLLLHLSTVDDRFYQDWKLLTTGTVAVLNMPDDWQQLDKHCAQLLDLVRGRSL